MSLHGPPSPRVSGRNPTQKLTSLANNQCLHTKDDLQRTSPAAPSISRVTRALLQSIGREGRQRWDERPKE
ncbi:hypothetical protein CBOM_01112 [Ceraceosorus bombacis]|uniref:Uncharacterized protein n=1 Tax=Ceraceosorus bombacis TaxID=401625 RepID=A0A0P1BB14_9BASI|nr:hypothetical protein CBOM_01112 [Ceraceosorus bombacis]